MLLVLSSAPAQSGGYALSADRSWEAQPGPERGSDEWTIGEARRLLAEDRAHEARKLLDAWLDQHERSGSPLLPQAYMVRGDARNALDDEFGALYDYEAIIKGYKQSEEFPAAVGRELEIGLRYADGLKLKFIGIRMIDSAEVAVELLVRVQERLPRSQAAEKAAIELADFYYRQRDMKLAHEAYDLYLLNFPNGPSRVKAQQRRIQTDVARFKGPRYNAAGLINAKVQIKDFAQRFPVEAEQSGMNEALVARLDESMAAQILDTAEWYLATGDDPSARLALRRLIRDHPRTLSAERGEATLRSRGWWQEPAPAPPEPMNAVGSAPQPAPPGVTK